jgi:hypothetical protein
MIVHFVQVHAVGEHLLDISNLDWEARCQMLTINLNSTGVRIVVAPDVDFLGNEHEVGTSLPMQGLVFLDWIDWKSQQVGTAHNVSLQVHEEGVITLEVSVNALNSHSDFLVIVTNKEGSDLEMRCALHQEWCIPREDNINLLELLSSFNQS